MRFEHTLTDGRILTAVLNPPVRRTCGRPGGQFFSKYTILYICLICSVVMLSVASAADVASRDTGALARQVAALVAKDMPKSAATAVVIWQVGQDAPLYTLNADRPMTPASNMKLLTTAAAMHTLGVDYSFTTSAYRAGDGLIVVGGGDPSLGDSTLFGEGHRERFEPFDTWADYLADKAVTSLSHVTVDMSFFDDQYRHPNWPYDQSHKWYAAPVAALNFNDNCLDVTFSPAAGGSHPVALQVFPDIPQVKVQWKLNGSAKASPWVTREITTWNMVVGGGTHLKRPIDTYVSVPDPAELVGQVLVQRLQEHGISTSGDTVYVHAPGSIDNMYEDAELIATHHTRLPDVVWRANTHSQNLFAECLMKTIGRQYESAAGARRPQGSWPAGCMAVREFLETIGAYDSQCRIDDGCGLSRDNKVTVDQLAAILEWAWRQPYRQTWVDSLAPAGGDGTLRRRLRENAYRGVFRGKTGYINGVRALSGYCMGGEGEPVIVAMLSNDIPSGSQWKVRDAHDDIVRLVIDWQRQSAP